MSLERHRGSTTDHDKGEKFHEDRVRVAQIIEEAVNLHPDSFMVTDVRNAPIPHTKIVTLATLERGSKFYMSVTREHDPLRQASRYQISKHRKYGFSIADFRYRLDVTSYGSGIYADDEWAECNATAEKALFILTSIARFSLPESAYTDHDRRKERNSSVPTLTEFLQGASTTE